MDGRNSEEVSQLRRVRRWERGRDGGREREDGREEKRRRKGGEGGHQVFRTGVGISEGGVGDPAARQANRWVLLLVAQFTQGRNVY